MAKITTQNEKKLIHFTTFKFEKKKRQAEKGICKISNTELTNSFFSVRNISNPIKKTSQKRK